MWNVPRPDVNLSGATAVADGRCNDHWHLSNLIVDRWALGVKLGVLSIEQIKPVTFLFFGRVVNHGTSLGHQSDTSDDKKRFGSPRSVRCQWLHLLDPPALMDA